MGSKKRAPLQEFGIFDLPNSKKKAHELFFSSGGTVFA
jgi:hypothetical protein